MYKFDQASLRVQLSKLSMPRQLAFALLLCERMMPGLRRFSKDTSYSILLYEKGLELGWRHLVGESTRDECDELSDRCLQQAPHTEDFTHGLVSAALNAALSIALLMKHVIDTDVDHIVEIASLAKDTADLYVQHIIAIKLITSTSEDAILGHPVLQKELGRQREDFEFLASAPGGEAAKFEAAVRERARGASPVIPRN
jgi:uncharacterized protein YjaG (DUF416 family)